MESFANRVRGRSSTLELSELLNRPTSELLGVSSAAAAVLAEVGVATVFDLATSSLFASAAAVLAAATPGSPAARYGLVPGDLLNGDDTTPELAAGLPISALRVVPADKAAGLATALDVATIRDLALWPPALAARSLISEAFGATLSPEELQTEELRPRMGQFPTERVYYSTLVMLEPLQKADPGKLKSLDGAISLDDAIAGATQPPPAIGALLTFSQSWYSQGVTLGHMLHSLALAPGEATRIAVIDWSRRQTATATEAISESERLDSAESHSRALSEVQNLTANDYQSGGSQSSSESSTTSGSAQMAIGTGFLTSLFASGDASGSIQSASTSASAQSSGWSLGNRSVLGSMVQNVNDRTEQHSSSVRNRRATAVREVSQNEHEQVSTRIVANYNHMHALTVQYYEVVQIYRTEAKLHRADRCLFLPMQVLDFAGDNGQAYVDRFRGALGRAALTRRIASLLADDTTAVTISPQVPIAFSGFDPRVSFAAKGVRTDLTVRSPFTMPERPLPIEVQATETVVNPLVQSKMTALAATVVQPISPELAALRIWDDALVANVSNIVSRALFRPGSDALHVPDDTILLSITFTGVTLRNARLQRISDESSQNFSVSDSGQVILPAPVPLIDLTAIDLAKAEAPAANGSMSLVCSYLGRHFTLPAIPLDLKNGTAFQRVVTLASDQADRRKEILGHLQSHRDYYSRAVYQALDSTTTMLLLSSYQFGGRPLSEIVEPQPVKVAGNYLILRAPVDIGEPSGLQLDGEPAAWGEYLSARGLALDQPSDQRLIPIPTGGVFAEAVLGRSNAAEKLDITRYWNWQDSPIPLSPPEIQPVGTGSRATPEDLKPGQLGQPVLNIVNPTSLPDPAGLGAGFAALASGNMFRDMSGLAGTQGLNQAAMTASQQAATDAGQIASANLRTEAQKSVAMGQIAADIVKSLLGQGGSGSVQSISADGAKINHGQSMDQRGVAGGGGTGSGGAGPTDVAIGHSAGGGSSANGRGAGASGGSNGSAGSFEAGAFNAATHGIDPGNTAAVFGATEPLVDSGLPMIENVDNRYVRGAYTPSELAGLVGEQITESALRGEGHIVFSDWRKHISQSGFDLVTLDKDGVLWIVDNKAQFRGIGGANALTGAGYDAYLAELRNFLTNTHPVKAEADLALAALNQGKIKKVVANGFAGEATRFTAGLFEKGLVAYDIRIGKLFTDHATWTAAFEALKAVRVLRRTVRGTGILGVNVLAVCAVAELGNFLITSGPDLKQLALESIASFGLDTILSRLPGGFFASFALGLESDSPAVTKERQLEREANDLLQRLPGAAALTDQQKADTLEALKAILRDPMQFPAPPPRPADPPKYLLPGLLNPNWQEWA